MGSLTTTDGVAASSGTISVSDMTELEALNTCLAAIKQAPVSSFSATTADAVNARFWLDKVNREVQMKGWSWNRDIKVKLSPSSGEISVAAYLRVDVREQEHPRQKYTVRNDKIYNREDQTFTITEDVYVDAIVELSWSQLPNEARQYIAIRAARLFADRQLGSQKVAVYTRQDEFEAERNLLQLDLDAEDLNTYSLHYSHVVDRRL